VSAAMILSIVGSSSAAMMKLTLIFIIGVLAPSKRNTSPFYPESPVEVEQRSHDA
jgi:hypothetical protein